MSSRRRPRRSTVVLLVAVALLAVGTWVAYFSPLLVAREVAVEGQRQVSRADVLAAAVVPLGTPLARQDVDGIARRVTGIPAVRAASVGRRWPGTVVVTVSERSSVLAVRESGDYVLVDGEGVAYARIASRPDGTVLAQVDPDDRGLLAEVGRVAAALPAGLVGEVEEVTAPGPEEIALRLRSGVEVRWGSAADSPLKAQIVTALLEQEPKKTIDVSSPHSPALQ